MSRLLAALLALAGAHAAPAAAPEARVYSEGQVWEYRTRPQDEGSLLRIQRIEDHPSFAARGPVYHVSVVGVRFLGRGEATVIGHLPVSRATLDASVTRLSRRAAQFPDAAEGIAMWREAEGGVFDAPMSEIVGIAEEGMRQAAEVPQ